MPTKVNVKGNRNLKKSSRKSSKKSSKKGLDFTSVLSEDMQANSEMNQMNQMNPMGGMMGMNPMNPMNGMGEMMGMPMGPSMGMPVDAPMQNMMMLGKDTEKHIDPLHVQYMVPHNQNYNINNYGISPDQLTGNNTQASGLSQQFNNMHMGAQGQQGSHGQGPHGQEPHGQGPQGQGPHGQQGQQLQMQQMQQMQQMNTQVQQVKKQ